MEKYLRVGVITSTHGVHGEVKVYPTTDDVRRFDYLKDVVLDTKKDIWNYRLQVKYFKNMVILHFKQFDNVDKLFPIKEWIYL